MNHLERFRALMRFQPVDRLPRIEWANWWDQTIARWHHEGLPRHLTDRYDIVRYFGLDVYYQVRTSPRARSFPTVAHGQGLVRYERDYGALRVHLYPPQDSALAQLATWGQEQSRGEAVVWLTLDGFFWYPRTLLGIERHLYAFYDQPDLMRRLNDDLCEYYVTFLAQVRSVGAPAFMTFAEDMSYNQGPMISRSLFDQFIAPYYRLLVPILHDMGTMVMVDSDGDVTELIPWLQAVGVDGVLPLERQAGVDAGRLRQTFPSLRMIGHYDKMVMNCGEAAMRSEFRRLLSTVRTGGFLPCVDHQTPPGVSLDDYRLYLRLQQEFSEQAVR